MKTAVVEKDTVGGRCLNYACIPAKAVLRVADILSEIDDADEFGITVDGRTVDFGKVCARREKVIKTLTGGVAGLFKKNKIDYIEGVGVARRRRQRARSATTTATSAAKAIVLATGSVAQADPRHAVRRPRDRHRGGVGARRSCPKTLAVVGAGASGAEIASRVRPARHRGAAVRGARPRAADRGRRHLQGRRRARSPSRTSRSTPARSVENVEAHDDKVTFTYGDETGEAD